MHKKLMLACMAIAAFAAFVIAPSASAVNLTSNGVTVPAGTSITATNTGLIGFEAGELTQKCDHAHIVGTVTKDKEGTIAGEIKAANAKFNGTGTSTDCTSPLGSTKWTVNSNLCLHIASGTDTGTITGCGANVTYSLNVTGVTVCAYQTASIAATITTGTGKVTISKQSSVRDTGSLVFCPNNGSLTMELDFFTTDGTELKFS